VDVNDAQERFLCDIPRYTDDHLIHPRRSLDLHSFTFHVIAFVVVPSHTLPVSAMHRPTLYISTVKTNPYQQASAKAFIRISQPIRDLNKSKSPNPITERTAHLSTSGLPVIALSSRGSILNLALNTLFISSFPSRVRRN
jgi:hypothetical protein